MTFDPYLKSTGTTNINTISKINIANVISMAAPPHYYYTKMQRKSGMHSIPLLNKNGSTLNAMRDQFFFLQYTLGHLESKNKQK